MSLRDALTGKTRRRVVVPVQVSDPGRARDAVTSAEQKHALLDLTAATATDKAGHKKALTAAKKALDEARAALASHYVDVEFEAAAPADVDRVLGQHANAKGEWDEAATLPHLAALCASDDDLRDPDWWAEQLATVWTRGESGDLWGRLLDLNFATAPANLPKD